VRTWPGKAHVEGTSARTRGTGPPKALSSTPSRTAWHVSPSIVDNGDGPVDLLVEAGLDLFDRRGAAGRFGEDAPNLRRIRIHQTGVIGDLTLRDVAVLGRDVDVRPLLSPLLTGPLVEVVSEVLAGLGALVSVELVELLVPWEPRRPGASDDRGGDEHDLEKALHDANDSTPRASGRCSALGISRR